MSTTRYKPVCVQFSLFFFLNIFRTFYLLMFLSLSLTYVGVSSFFSPVVSQHVWAAYLIITTRFSHLEISYFSPLFVSSFMYIFFQIPNRAFGCFRRLSTNGSMSFLIDKQVRPYIHTKSLLNRISLRLLVPFFLSFFPSRHGRVLCFRFYRVSTTCGTGGERHQERRKKKTKRIKWIRHTKGRIQIASPVRQFGRRGKTANVQFHPHFPFFLYDGQGEGKSCAGPSSCSAVPCGWHWNRRRITFTRKKHEIGAVRPHFTPTTWPANNLFFFVFIFIFFLLQSCGFLV